MQAARNHTHTIWERERLAIAHHQFHHTSLVDDALKHQLMN